MPFTASHPAAVLPLMRLGLVPSALVIGSMAPDLPYYLQLGTQSSLTHTMLGVVTVDLAMALAGFVLWQGLVAPAAVAIAPRGLRQRLAPALPVAWRAHAASARAALLVIASLVVGGLTHVAWDAFTHEDRWGTRHIAWLTERHGALAGYRWAQYASGVVGLGLIAIAAWRWWRRAPVGDPAAAPQRIPALAPRTAGVVATAVAGVALVAGLAGFAAGLSGGLLRSAVFDGATWGGGAGLLAALIAAAWIQRHSPAGRPTVRRG